MIQIIRLKNGEDIIGQVFEDTGDYEIQEPMSVSIEYCGQESGLVMNHWLPVQIIDKNKTSIKKDDVLATFRPNKEFEEYYEHTVKKMQDLLKAKEITDAMTDEEIEDIMDALQDSEGQVLH